MKRLPLLGVVVLLCLAAGCQGETAPKTPPVDKSGKQQEPRYVRELAAFRLGTKLTELAEASATKTDAEKQRQLLNEAATLAETLNLDKGLVKPPPPPTGNLQQDVDKHLAFLMDRQHPCEQLGQQILNKHGRKIRACFDLPVKARLAGKVYVPHSGTEVNRTAAAALEEAGKGTELMEPLYKDYVTALQSARDDPFQMELRGTMMLARVGAYLEAKTKQ